MFYSINTPLKTRLVDAIHSVKNDIKSFNGEGNEFYKQSAEDALKAAAHQISDKASTLNINSGWNYLHMAEQYLVRCMDDNQKNIKAGIVVKEASKIGGWRKEQIFLMLRDDEGKLLAYISADLLIEAMKLRDDYYTTMNHKMALHKSSVNRLTLALVIIITLIVILSFIMNLTRPDNPTNSLLIAGLFGTLGASFSMAYSLSTSTLESKIPEQLLGISVTIIRLAIGATAAIIIFMLYTSKFFSNIFSEAFLNSDYVYLVFSFMAGFSERWVVKIFETVAKEPDKK